MKLVNSNWGGMYDNGTDIKKDDQEAAKWYELAAEQGNEKANPRLCELYAFGDISIRNYEESIKWCNSAAEHGHTLAREVGQALMYHHGIDAKPNLRKARRWYQKAAQKGYAPAQVELGNILERLGPRFFGPNPWEAIEWYELAAEQEYIQAYVALGEYYMDKGFYFTAEKWYQLAAEEVHIDTQFRLGTLYLLGENFYRDKLEAVKWYRLAAENGKIAAQSILGFMYDVGEAVPEDDQEAIKWYQLAAEQGHAPAQYGLGKMYDRGEGVPENDQEAVKWYQLAAEQGEVKAQASLGKMYANGEGVPKDYMTAYAWMNIAATGRDPEIIDAKNKIRSAMTYDQVVAAQKLSNEIFSRLEPGNSQAVDSSMPDLESVQLEFHSDLKSIRI